MKRLIVGGALAAAVILAALCGCEVESVDQLSVQISPNRATIAKGETLEFRASGWSTYRWSIDNPYLGALSAEVGETVYYTATAATNATQILRVVATGTSAGTGTNRTEITLSAEAYITHTAPVKKPEEDGNNVTSTTTTTTIPSTTTTTTSSAFPPTPS